MIYRVIGLMSGSSLDGLDIAFVEFEERAGNWTYAILQADCEAYPEEWLKRLQNATSLNARDYLQLHSDYGHWLGERVNVFVQNHHLEYRVQLVSSHGHTCFHSPPGKMTAQLGDGAAIAAETRLAVVSELRSMDIALGGQGAPIVPIGEKLLWPDYELFLNVGGIANLTARQSLSASGNWLAFDVCPANRVMNLISARLGKLYDEDGKLAADGKLVPELLRDLNCLDYYGKPYPKSLDNEFGTGIVYPLVMNYDMSTEDALCTYVEHIVEQIANAVQMAVSADKLAIPFQTGQQPIKMLVTGGGALNGYLTNRLKEKMEGIGVEAEIPERQLIEFKEALVMALMGVLRWREESNAMASVTGAAKDSINGAVWMGKE